jgi:hypothetical protein
MKTPTKKQERWAFKVYAGNYLSEHDLEALGISADWHLYLSPTEPPSAAQCNQQMNAYDLSACPCCGGRATIIGTLKTCEWSAICTMCGLETAHMMQPKDAASAWNKRYAPDEEGSALESQGDVVSTKPRDGEAKQPEAQAVARLVIVDRGGGFKAIRTWDDIGDLPPGEHFLFSAAHPTGDRVRWLVEKVRSAELFEDGVRADLFNAGVRTIAAAYIRGRQDSCDELAAALDQEKGSG